MIKNVVGIDNREAWDKHNPLFKKYNLMSN